MAFFFTADGDCYLNGLVKEPQPDQEYYVYCIPKARVIRYARILKLSLNLSSLAIVITLVHVTNSLYTQTTIDPVLAVIPIGIGCVAMLLIAFQSLCCKVKKLNISHCKLNVPYAKNLYLAMLFASLSACLCCLFMDPSGSLHQLLIPLITGTLSIALVARWNWLRKLPPEA